MNIHKDRVEQIRGKMREAGIDVYYIPMSDCHNSEYVADHFRCIEFVSGFTGSAGSLVITMNGAWLFGDGRYYIQAANQIEGSGIELMKIAQPGVPELADFLKEKVAEAGKTRAAAVACEAGKGEEAVSTCEASKGYESEAGTLGFDGSVIPADFGQKFDCRILCDRDLAGEIWEERPAQTFSEILELPVKYTGESAGSKIRRIRKELEKKAPAGADYLYILNSLDDIAWIFNLRANDVENNPVQFGYAAISRDQVMLFTGAPVPQKAAEELCRELTPAPETVEELEKDLEQDIEGKEPLVIGTYSRTCLTMDGYDTVLMDCARISYDTWCYYKEKGAQIIHISNPSTRMKAVKNETEIRCLKEALVRDSAVVVNFMCWLKKNVGRIEMDEVSVADHLQEMRMAQEGYIELSFGTISAYKENAAQMHYAPKRGQCKKIEAESFLLVDSGCQYQDGTTDITRTFALGPLTEEEKKAFTLTAVSMLRLMNAKFFKGCSGENLDIMAREPMWNVGWDYKCGTGHGVGHVLNVHEGPHNIRWKINYEHPTAVLEPGMVVTDEPGVYREGKYGVRTENELLVTNYMETDDGTFLQFENLTFIPIDLDAIDPQYMTAEDLQMLNDYHRKTYEVIAPLVPEEVREWLKEYTREVTR